MGLAARSSATVEWPQYSAGLLSVEHVVASVLPAPHPLAVHIPYLWAAPLLDVEFAYPALVFDRVRASASRHPALASHHPALASPFVD